jgi:hypothetical protein
MEIQMKRIDDGKASTQSGDSSELMRISEFAHKLGISIWTARSWAYAGKIASVKLGSLLQVAGQAVTTMDGAPSFCLKRASKCSTLVSYSMPRVARLRWLSIWEPREQSSAID